MDDVFIHNPTVTYLKIKTESATLDEVNTFVHFEMIICVYKRIVSKEMLQIKVFEIVSLKLHSKLYYEKTFLFQKDIGCPVVFGGDIIGMISHVAKNNTDWIYMVNTVHFGDVKPSGISHLNEVQQSIQTNIKICEDLTDTPWVNSSAVFMNCLEIRWLLVLSRSILAVAHIINVFIFLLICK